MYFQFHGFDAIKICSMLLILCVPLLIFYAAQTNIKNVNCAMVQYSHQYGCQNSHLCLGRRHIHDHRRSPDHRRSHHGHPIGYHRRTLHEDGPSQGVSDRFLA
jgi:hypothetical protein